MTHNPNCDGARCTATNGEVRVYPLGGGGNLILCQHCFNHENVYRKQRQNDFTQKFATPHNLPALAAEARDAWPIVPWTSARVYEVAP